MDFRSVYTEDESAAIEKEFTRLKEKCYLDHAGTTLYAESQIRAIQEHLTQNLFCNPHTSRTTEDLIDQVRYRVLKHFNTRSSEYSVIFTSGTTASLKLLAECFTFDPQGAFVYLRDSHTSVLGMRGVVGTDRIFPIEREALLRHLTVDGNSSNEFVSLLVFPAQCNFNGVKYPLELVEKIKDRGLINCERNQFFICVDAASFVSTSFMDLTRYKPDFVSFSFYKMFGFPTGLGALLVHRDAAHLLHKRYYGGGTVKIAMAGRSFHVDRDSLSERLEDGTVPFTSIISLLQGFETLERLIPPVRGQCSMERISAQTFLLGQYCFRKLQALRHGNGQKVVELYHDGDFEDSTGQGGIVNFNILHDNASFVGFAEIACMASLHDIVLRTGCFCNPGACQRLLSLTDDDVLKHYRAGHICGDANDLIDGQPTGSVRVSVGYMTRRSDVDRLVQMIENCYIRKHSSNRLPRSLIVCNYKNYCQPQLKMICLFPIKSCGALKVTTSWPLCPKGLKYDREFVVVDENGVALTQKKLAEMCLIRPRINLETNEMILTHPSMADFTLDLGFSADASGTQTVKLCQTKVCQDNVQAIDCGDDVSEWISVALQTSGLRLLKQSDVEVRSVQTSEREISLSNQAQFLLINQTSVRWLAGMVPDWDDLRVEPSLESLVDRFRGNLVIETSKELEECRWQRVKIGESEFSVDGPCSRCQMICIDQTSGVKTAEPLRTIAKEFKGKMRFGVYLSNLNLRNNSGEELLYCGSTIQGLIE
ncbi:molybdenum cofactor sulfurase 3 [Toxorhynchites rutilus septentrionalis]|uniref:molybdenum cofactor sulfurase 3 n=1 Tax=Toxorhynchites rutilus septentrionalis TaxID=329112 RepID=UPI00247A9D18|nr:molybdenum cofactor sulfurase 3 [Toxorhynchites rutilus septentrionalis]